MIESHLVSKVHQANAEAHDYYAPMHDRSVPYIHRGATRRYYWSLLKRAVSRYCELRGAAVLELGCGTGTFTELVMKSGARSFCGVDLSPKMLKRAKEKASAMVARGLEVSYENASMEDFAPAHAETFDIIYSPSFLHHLVDLNGGLKLIRSMLKPGGVYVGFHEQITGRDRTFTERVDSDLLYLFGYDGAIFTPWRERFKNKLNEYYGIFRSRIFGFLRAPSPLQVPATPPGIGKKATNYVDYQLNFPFSLSKSAAGIWEVVPYCYMGYVELMFFCAPKNHEMLIMPKNTGAGTDKGGGK